MIFLKPTLDNKAITLNGSAPYIHWFDAPGSVGMYHYKRILVYADNQNIKCTFPDNSPFFLYIPRTDWDGTAADVLIQNAGDVLRKSCVYTSAKIIPVLIVCRIDEPGEWIENLTVTIGSADPEDIRVGIEVRGENEILKINLTNKGIEIPESIEKAIYQTDVKDDSIDWILLNDKWQELLNNHMDMLGCKGNYKSLINSLKWFDYGNLVELREFWKLDTVDGVKLFDHPVVKAMTDWYKSLITTSAKSTYMMLRHVSNSIYEGGQVKPQRDYPDGFVVPKYIDREYESLMSDAVKWSKQEIAMKMYLLGRYYETYFMPVHLDLLVSTIEHIHLDVPYQLITGGYSEQTFDLSDVGDISDFNIKTDWNTIEGFDGVFNMEQLDNVFGYSSIRDDQIYNYVPFGFDVSGEISEDTKFGPYLGVVRDSDITSSGWMITAWPADEQLSQLAMYTFSGLGAIATLTFKANNGITIHNIKATTDINAPKIDGIRQPYSRNYKADAADEIDNTTHTCNFLVQEPGDYFLTLDFEYAKDGDELHALKTLKLRVQDNTTASLQYYKLQYRTPNYNALRETFESTLDFSGGFVPDSNPKYMFDNGLILSTDNVINKNTRTTGTFWGDLKLSRENSAMVNEHANYPRYTKCLLLHPTVPINWTGLDHIAGSTDWWCFKVEDNILAIPSKASPSALTSITLVYEYSHEVFTDVTFTNYIREEVYGFICGWHYGVLMDKTRTEKLNKDVPVYISPVAHVGTGDELIYGSAQSQSWKITSLKTGKSLGTPEGSVQPFIVACTYEATPTGRFLVDFTWNWGREHRITEVAPFIYLNSTL